jgi:hypothetical protein
MPFDIITSINPTVMVGFKFLRLCYDGGVLNLQYPRNAFMTIQCTEASTEVLELKDNEHMTYSSFIIYYHKIITLRY